MINYKKSIAHHKEACKYLPGGVCSNARLSSEMVPICFERGLGPLIFDVDGNEYIDYVLGLGPLILGHCPSVINEAVKKQLALGSLFASAALGEEKLGKMVCELFHSVELVSFTCSGSEAVHMALRLARAFTKKKKVVKFEGCYHGWMDNILMSVHPTSKVAMGPEETPNSVPEGLGQSEYCNETIIVPWNNPKIIEEVFQNHGNEIAALILEPIPCNNGVILPEEGFLSFLRDLTYRHECTLIFDEVITGFRVDLGGAQGYYDITPDITVFGKAVGGGLPISGFGGIKEVMDLISKGVVVRSGTYNSNALCVAASKAVLAKLSAENGASIKIMNKLGRSLMEGIADIFAEHKLPLTVQGIGSTFSTFFSKKPIRSYRDTMLVNSLSFKAFWRNLISEGIRIWDTPRGIWFLSTAHDAKDISVTLAKVDKSARSLRVNGNSP